MERRKANPNNQLATAALPSLEDSGVPTRLHGRLYEWQCARRVVGLQEKGLFSPPFPFRLQKIKPLAVAGASAYIQEEEQTVPAMSHQPLTSVVSTTHTARPTCTHHKSKLSSIACHLFQPAPCQKHQGNFILARSKLLMADFV
jgi:hypothetical protein